MKRSILLLSSVLLLTLVATSSVSAATWTEIQEVDVGISYPSWVQIQRVDVVVYPAQWTLVQTVDVEISQAEWVLIQTVEVSVTIPADVLLWTGLGDDNLASNPANWNQGIAPFNGADIVFNATSVKDCTWDLTTAVYSFTLATGYTGEVTQGDVDMSIGAGGFRLLSGIFNPNSLRMVYCDGDVIYGSSGSVLPDKLGLQMEPGEHTLSLAKELRFRTLINKAELTHLGNTLFLNNHVNDGTIYLDGVIRFYYTDVTLSGRYIGNGELLFSRKALVGLNLYTAPDAVIDVNLNFRNEDDFNPNLYMLLSDLSTHKSVQVQSIHGEYPEVRIDANGHSLTADSVTVGTGGNILWGEGTHRIGGLDTSAGASDFETSQVIMTGGSIKLGAGQQINDLTLVAGTRTKMLSDVDVKGTIVGIQNLLTNNHRLIISGATRIGAYDSQFNVSEPVFIPIVTPIQSGLEVYGDIPRWMRYDADKGGLYGIPTQLGMNDFNVTVYSPYVDLMTQHISFAVVDVPTSEHASKGQSVGNIISIVLTMIIVGICGITRKSNGGFDYDVSNALLGAAVGISVLVFASVIPSYGLVLVALIFVAMYWGGR